MYTEKKENLVERIIEKTNLSRSTIFRYFAKKSIRESSKVQIEKAIEEINNETNPTPLSNKDKTIIVSTSYLLDYFKGNALALNGIMSECSQKGYQLTIEYNKITTTTDSNVAGVIILAKNNNEYALQIEELDKANIPYILINRIVNTHHASFVATDNYLLTKEIVAHLISQGYKKLALYGETGTNVAQEKKRGFVDGLIENGIKPDTNYIFSMEMLSPQEAINKGLLLESPPDAWVTMDDEMGIKFIKLLSDKGLNIPENIAVTGMNDISSASDVTPTLTSSHIPFYEMGQMAARELISIIENKAISSIHMIMKHELRIRESSHKLGIK